MKTIISDQTAINQQAAQRIRELLGAKPDAALALSANPQLTGLYAELSRLCARGELSFSRAKLFALCELEGTEFCRNALSEALLHRVDARPENCFFPDPVNAEDYDRLIAQAGGLSLAVLTLGSNGRFGWNEPATPFDSLTHLQRLAPATRRELAAALGGEENVPARGVTMGIRTVTRAEEIMVLAFGEAQADPVFRMLYGRNDSVVPAAFLQLPANVTLFADEAAAKKL